MEFGNRGTKMKMKTKIRPSAVRYREPYYVKCSICGLMISGTYPEQTCEKANGRGWKYDHTDDKIICNFCHEQEEDKEEKKGGENEA